MKKTTLTQSRLKELLEYREGKFYWKVRKSNRALKGTRAGSEDDFGRRNIRVDNHTYREARLVWLYHHGSLPLTKFIVHKDGDSMNISIENLNMSCSTTYKRRSPPVGNAPKSPYKGVTWDREAEQWLAQITYKKRNLRLGLFDDPSEAKKCADENAVKYGVDLNQMREH